MAASAKKKKEKSKTLSLTEFLGDKNAPTFAPSAKTSWADQVEEQDAEGPDVVDYGVSNAKKIDITALPTAPRSVRGANIDLSKVPTKAPFKAFLGNLSYDVSVVDIEKFFRNLKVVGVDLPQSQDGRMKGFGYAEFEDRQSLIEALSLNDGALKNRNIRIDLADRTQGGREDGGREGGYGGNRRQDDGEDKTTGDWRRPREDRPDEVPDDQYRPAASNDGGFNRDRSERGGGRTPFSDRASKDETWGHEARKPDSDFNRGDDRGPSSYKFANRDYRYENSDRSNFNSRQDRSFGGDRQDRPYGDRQERSYGNRSYGGERGETSDRDKGNSYGFDRGGENRNRDDREFDRKDLHKIAPSAAEVEESLEEGKEPKERRRLQLKPRSKPVEEIGKTEKASAIFGGAKPVDTASREKEIEERLKREVVDVEQPEEKEVNSRPSRSSVSDGEKKVSRSRRESSNSNSEVVMPAAAPSRERITSTSSSKSSKSVTAETRPTPPTGKAPDAHATTSNDSLSTSSSKISVSDLPPTSPPVKYVDAPPPKENAWSKRKTVDADLSRSASDVSESSSASGARKDAPVSSPPASAFSSSASQSSAPAVNNSASAPSSSTVPVRRVEVHVVHDGDEPRDHKTFVPAAPPAANVWEKRRQEQQQEGKGKEETKRPSEEWKPAPAAVRDTAPVNSVPNNLPNESNDVKKSDRARDEGSSSGAPERKSEDDGKANRGPPSRYNDRRSDGPPREDGGRYSDRRSDVPHEGYSDSRSDGARNNSRYESSSGRGRAGDYGHRGGGAVDSTRGHSRGGGRGSGYGDAAGRGGGRRDEEYASRRGPQPELAAGKREKPRNVDEMPKLESQSAKDWSNSNKFSMLMGDEEARADESGNDGEEYGQEKAERPVDS